MRDVKLNSSGHQTLRNYRHVLYLLPVSILWVFNLTWAHDQYFSLQIIEHILFLSLFWSLVGLPYTQDQEQLAQCFTPVLIHGSNLTYPGS